MHMLEKVMRDMACHSKKRQEDLACATDKKIITDTVFLCLTLTPSCKTQKKKRERKKAESASAF